MKNIIMPVILLFLTTISSSAQFLSQTDVLYYLNGKTFIGGSSGDATLSFKEMGSQLTVNGNYLLYQPDIKILSRSSAIVKYYGIQDPSVKVGLIVNGSTNIIIDGGGNGSAYTLRSNFESREIPNQREVVAQKQESTRGFKAVETTETQEALEKRVKNDLWGSPVRDEKTIAMDNEKISIAAQKVKTELSEREIVKPINNVETVTDIDNNLYYSVKIGTQIWIESNLNVERFRNGDPILYAKTKEEWLKANSEKTPAWCYYDGNPENGVKYGKLYNFYALIDPRGLSPNGYRLPNDKDWDILVDALGGKDVAGSKMRQSPENVGFSGILSGQRDEYGEFNSLNILSSWWSSDITTVIPPPMIDPPVSLGRFRSVSATNSKVIDETRMSAFRFAEIRDIKGKFEGCGLSVRCIKEDN